MSRFNRPTFLVTCFFFALPFCSLLNADAPNRSPLSTIPSSTTSIPCYVHYCTVHFWLRLWSLDSGIYSLYIRALCCRTSKPIHRNGDYDKTHKKRKDMNTHSHTAKHALDAIVNNTHCRASLALAAVCIYMQRVKKKKRKEVCIWKKWWKNNKKKRRSTAHSNTVRY